jgi:hypothetical protein
VALGQVFYEYFGFPCQSSFHQLLHNHHRSSGAGTIGKQWSTYQVDSVSPHSEKLQDTTSYQEELVHPMPVGLGNVVLIPSKPYAYWLLLCKRRTLLTMGCDVTAAKMHVLINCSEWSFYRVKHCVAGIPSRATNRVPSYGCSSTVFRMRLQIETWYSERLRNTAVL